MKSYIPTIDISSLLNLEFSTLKAKNTIRKIEKACVDVGFFQAEDGIRDSSTSRGLGDVYKRQILFNNIPTTRTFVGVAIIIGAGIYIYFREKVKDQMIVTDTPNR